VFQADLQAPEKGRKINKNTPESLGIDSVQQHSGYINLDGLDKHLFYWMFESRNDPVTDPVVLWLSGGPGTSSLGSMLLELGPSTLNSLLKPAHNPYSWNSNASVIFLDLPVGVGYSYSDRSHVSSTVETAKDIYKFLESFFHEFPRFRNNSFHIASESYGGHYVPAVATEIISHEERSFELESILIGNGYIDPILHYRSFKTMACDDKSSHLVIDQQVCVDVERAIPACEALEQVCYKNPTSLTCVEARKYCQSNVLQPFVDAGVNVFDIRKQFKNDSMADTGYLEEYFRSHEVINAVGAKVDNFTRFNDDVIAGFTETGDEAKQFKSNLDEVLNYGISVLLYAGDKDFICNWMSLLDIANSMNYNYHKRFERAKLKPWYTTNGTFAGQIKNSGNFTFLKLFDAPHQAPREQPQVCLDMVNRWLLGDYSLGYE
jgi:cathepsin A (carboxypeptidase C)